LRGGSGWMDRGQLSTEECRREEVRGSDRSGDGGETARLTFTERVFMGPR